MIRTRDYRRGAASAAIATALLAAGAARAQETTTPAPDTPVAKAGVATDTSEIPILVVADHKNQSAILPKNSNAFGLDLPQISTPRSSSNVSLAMIDQYSLTTIRDLIAVTPGVFTASFYGVDGSVNIRGEYADNYFLGFKRVENQGTYITPIESALDLEIVRGIASPAYGTGRAGGYVNFDPRSDRAERFMNGQAALGELDGTIGTYKMYRGEAEYGAPLQLGAYRAGFDIYYEHLQADQYFHGIDPKHNLVQAGFATELPAGFTFKANYQWYRATGMEGTTGINRVTQALVDHGSYVSGTPIAQIVRPGAPYIVPGDIDAIGGVTNFYGTANDYSKLDPATIKEVHLGNRNVIHSPYDFGDVETNTGYLGLFHPVGSGRLKIEGFLDDLNADTYNGYGFAKHLRDRTEEARISLEGKLEPASWIKGSYIAGGDYRYYEAHEGYNYARGYLILDRQDLSVGATPDSIINPLYVTGEPWDQYYNSKVGQAGLFFNGTVKLFDWIRLTGGVRYDDYDVSASNTGLLDYSAALNTVYRADKGAVSWSGSVSIETPWGIVPYFIKGKSYALETQQGGAVAEGFVLYDEWLSPTRLTEGGVKASLFDKKLFLGLSVYRQKRMQTQLLSNTFIGVVTNGIEAEARWAINRHFGLSAVATRQKSRVHGCSYLFATPSQVGIANEDGWGEVYEVSSCSYAGYENGYVDRTQPRHVYGLFANYEMGSGFGATIGGNYVDKTGGDLPGAVVFPDYFLLRGSAHYDFGRFRVSVYMNNILDKRYYIPQRSTETEGTAMPGEGRTALVKFTVHI